MEETSKPETTIQFINRSQLQSDRLLRGIISITHNSTLQLKKLQITCLGIGQVNWAQNEEKRYFRTEKYIDEVRVILDHPSESGIFLSPGNTTFPFEFQLPRELPSNYKTWSCCVKYCCIAEITLITTNSKLFIYENKKVFRVNGNFDISNIRQEPANFSGEKVITKCFGCLYSGSISTSLSINKKAYEVGENIAMAVNIVNKTNKFINVFEAQLIRMTNFKDDKGKECSDHFPQTVCCVQYQVSQRPKSIGIARATLKIPEKIPPTNLGSGCTLFDVSYFLKLAIGCTDDEDSSSSLQIMIPITLGSRSTAIANNTTLNNITFHPRSHRNNRPPSYEDTVNDTVFSTFDELPPPPYYSSGFV